MLYSILQSNGQMSFIELVLLLVSYAALILVQLPVHEFAHAWAAVRLGDSTPRWHGRLSLNPLRHLDLWGTVLIVLFGFGYARPVPVNPRNFSNPKRDMALTALAGPASNLLMALLSLVLFRVVLLVTDSITVAVIARIVLVNVFASVNLSLAVFNLLPIPPLDGYRIFGALLPARWTFYMDQYHQYFRLGIILLIATGALSTPLRFLIGFFGNLLCTIVGLPRFF